MSLSDFLPKVCCLIVAMVGGPVLAGAQEPAWQRVHYPPVAAPGVEGQTFLATVLANHLNPEPFWQFNVMWRGGGLPQGDLADLSRVEVRYHGADGVVRRPPRGPRFWIGANGQRSFAVSFSHAGGALDESWVELKLPDQSYWFELPYGVVRPPDAPRIDEPERGSPALSPTMKVGSSDVLVPWQSVEYYPGLIQNGWRLQLTLSNRLMMRAEAVLYAENHRWQLESPATTMTIEHAGGAPIGSRKVGVRLPDGMRRSDTFHFDIPNLPPGWRGWGRVVTIVDGQRWECPIPSSLFQYGHGKAAPEHPQLLRSFERE